MASIKESPEPAEPGINDIIEELYRYVTLQNEELGTLEASLAFVLDAVEDNHKPDSDADHRVPFRSPVKQRLHNLGVIIDENRRLINDIQKRVSV